MEHSINDDEELLTAVKLLSPGTPLRDGVNLILQGGLGSLIVLSDLPEVLALTKGGFHLDCEYTPMRLFELAKMDGAIIISEDLKRIVCANANLVPDYEYSSEETGIRHQTGERFSKQTNKIVVTISERRKTLHLYANNQKYMFRSVPILISSANQTMLALERHIKSLIVAIQKLHLGEIRENVSLVDVITAIQYSEMARRTKVELDRHRIELGNEVVSLHLNSPEQEKVIENGFLVIRDYYKSDKRTEEDVLKRLQKLDDQALLNGGNISLAMGFPRDINSYIDAIAPRGYRILSMIPRLSSAIIKNLVESLGAFSAIRDASTDSLKDIKGIGEIRAQLINKEILRIIYMAEKWST
ncbi:DNA integrity scanning diadenylate cyclase DisA [Candidatus Uabimicrobium sp. HlEnr_7]|uniref:DNA integrity scanning diadenylate cyclase DisA n=1 Tax=Candidatus Uabimicrobium helgolandensis TaxID=3095367 RepID=UPI003556C936